MTSLAVRRGLFITFEGGDGSGKTTQRERLVEWLRESGHDVVETREPGGTTVGGVIRDLLLHHPGSLAPRAEALLYAADRAQHVSEVVAPALTEGRIVVQDRYSDSSVAYQGSGRILEPADIRALSEWATEGLQPDVTILLDLDRVAARERMDAAGRVLDRLEGEHDEFHRRVRESFLEMARVYSDRFFVVDASLPVDVVATLIRERVTLLVNADGFVGGGR